MSNLNASIRIGKLPDQNLTEPVKQELNIDFSTCPRFGQNRGNFLSRLIMGRSRGPLCDNNAVVTNNASEVLTIIPIKTVNGVAYRVECGKRGRVVDVLTIEAAEQVGDFTLRCGFGPWHFNLLFSDLHDKKTTLTPHP